MLSTVLSHLNYGQSNVTYWDYVLNLIYPPL